MLKYIVAVLAAILMTTAGVSFYQRNVIQKQAKTLVEQSAEIVVKDRELKAAAARERLTAKMLAQAKRETAALAAKQKESNAALDKALEANREWADRPIPPAVAEWLRSN